MKSLKDEKILIGPSSFAEVNRAPLQKLEELGCQIFINPYKRKIKKEELLELLDKNVTALIAGLETLDKYVLKNSKLKVISRCGAGMSNVDLEAAREIGISVYSTPFGPTRAVAELTVGCLLSLIRQVPQMDRALHDRQWDKRVGRQLKGMTVLVIGYGRIGQAVAQLIRAFDAKIIICDPNLNEENTYPVMALHKALPIADVVTLHAGGEDLILGTKEFSIMKTGVFILNGARGELIDDDALIKAIEAGQVSGAWLDTFHQEPYEGLITQCENVILTPHVGSYTYEGRLQMELDAVDNLIRGFQEWGQKG